MPASYADDEAVLPLCDTMGVSLVVHVSSSVEAPSLFIQHTCLPKVSFRISNSPTSHIDAATDFDALLIPHRLKVFVLNQALAFGPLKAVESHQVV